MLNRSMFVTSALGAAALSACGRQVTPNPTSLSNNLSGKMVIRFRVRGQLDFSNVNYVIVFNTSGTGGEPLPQAYLTSYTNYSYAFAVGAIFGGMGATLPTLFQYLLTTGSNNLNPHQVPLGASTTQLIPTDSTTMNEFQLTFTREQLDNPLAVSTATPAGSTATPTPTPTPTPNPSPTPSPTASPVGFAPTITPLPVATSYAQRLWYINFFTLSRDGNTVLDSLGPGGATDTSYSFSVDTSTLSPNALFRPAGVTGPSNVNAFIDGGEVDNYP